MHICSHAVEWLTLAFLDGLGNAARNRLAQHCSSPVEILVPAKLEKAILGPKAPAVFSDQVKRRKALERAEREIEALRRNGFSLIAHCCPQYPEELKNIEDPPFLLYGAGNLQCLSEPRVAVVGSRSATSYGKRCSTILAQDLAGRGICVVIRRSVRHRRPGP